MTTRQQEIQNIRKQYPGLYSIVLGLLILVIGFLLGASLFQGDDNGLSYITNLYTEIFSIGVTVVILDRVNAYRDRQNLKKRLLREVNSQSNETAKLAVECLRAEGWLVGGQGLLQNTSLWSSNLRGATLSSAYLKKTRLSAAHLEEANLIEADLEEGYLLGTYLNNASLYGANLKNSCLVSAHLEEARLVEANLMGADLSHAYLENAHLGGAELQGAKMMGTRISFTVWEHWGNDNIIITAILPDGEKWTPETDMEKFTNPDHIEYKATLEKINKIREDMEVEPIG